MTEKELLKIIEYLLGSIPSCFEEEIKTELLLLGIDLVRKGKSKGYIFISLRNKKYVELKKCKRKKELFETSDYIETYCYDDMISKSDTITDQDLRLINEKYEVLYTAFINMSEVRQSFIKKILKEHWKITKNNPNNTISITDIINNMDINKKTGFVMLRNIRKDLKKEFNSGRVNDLSRIKDFEKLYYLLTGNRISLNSRKNKTNEL